MKYTYHNLSGYAGKPNDQSTLNSQFFNKLFESLNHSPEILKEPISFPQRISRKDFFTELYELENDAFQNDLNFLQQQIKNNYLNSMQELQLNSKNPREFINYTNILLRYGQFEFLINNFPNNYEGSFELEIFLLLEIARNEFQLSCGNPVSVEKLIELYETYENDQTVTELEKIKLLNQIIVYFYRHQKNNILSNKAFDLSQLLLEKIQQLDDQYFIHRHLKSIVYRGLAMTSDICEKTKKQFMDVAFKLANNLIPVTEMQHIVALDNLFTCAQSLAKWHIINNRFDDAEKFLKKLTEIDANDSTGFSELGFFYFRSDLFSQAAEYFKKALELGPPGSGMNCYFYANCLDKLGDIEGTEYYLILSSKLDAQAISPLLDLVNFYLKNNSNEKAREIAKHILINKNLMEQLEDHEIQLIQNTVI